MINNARLSLPPALYLHLSTVNDLCPLWGDRLWTEFVARCPENRPYLTKLKTKHVVVTDLDKTDLFIRMFQKDKTSRAR